MSEEIKKVPYALCCLWTACVYLVGMSILASLCGVQNWWGCIASIVLYGGGWLRGKMR